MKLYCERGIAESTHRTYGSGLNRFLALCHAINIQQPFPVSEVLLCYFAAILAQRGLAPATIRTYLAAVWYAQVVRGFPEPCRHFTLPRLHLVQDGACRVRAQQGIPQTQSSLPIIPAILRQINCRAAPGPFFRLADPPYQGTIRGQDLRRIGECWHPTYLLRGP